jgi:hypothetical protein
LPAEGKTTPLALSEHAGNGIADFLRKTDYGTLISQTWGVQMKANRRWATKELRLRDSHVVQRRTALAQLFHSQARLTLDRPAKQALGKLGDHSQNE